MSLEFLLKLGGVFLGVMARTLIPWLRKLKGGIAGRFHKKYVYATGAALGIGLILTLAIFPHLETGAGGPPSFESYFKLFCLAFGFGFGWNGIVLEGSQWAEAYDDRRADKEAGRVL